MSGKKNPRSSAEKITIGILVVLAGINAVWGATLEHSGPVFASICFAFVAFLCWRKSHFQAGIIGGVFGLVIHIYELIFLDVGSLEGIDPGFFWANIVLPIPLIYYSYKSHQEVNR